MSEPKTNKRVRATPRFTSKIKPKEPKAPPLNAHSIFNAGGTNSDDTRQRLYNALQIDPKLVKELEKSSKQQQVSKAAKEPSLSKFKAKFLKSKDQKAAQTAEVKEAVATAVKDSAQNNIQDIQDKAEQAQPSDNSSQKFYPVVVYTPEELAQAQAQNTERIIVKGELASKLSKAFKGLRCLSASSLNTLALCVSGAALLAPFTGGVALGAPATFMGTLGAALTASAIAAISAIGLALVIAVFRGYDEIHLAGGSLELRLKRNSETKSYEKVKKDEAATKKAATSGSKQEAQSASKAESSE